jgi:phage gp29-like protein
MSKEKGEALFAEAQPASRKQIIYDEIATTRDGRDITRGYMFPGLPLQPQDDVLQAIGGGYDLYRAVLRDDQVYTGCQQRINALVSREWKVTPGRRRGGRRKIDQMAADSLAEYFDTLGSVADDTEQFAKVRPQSGFDGATQKMWYGAFYGYAIAEIMWARDGQNVALDSIAVRDRRRFAFDIDFNLRLLTVGNPMGEKLPARKFWAFTTGADHDDEPYGLGLAHWLYWPVHFKKNDLAFWLMFMEKFAAPTALGEYPPELDSAVGEEAQLLAAAKKSALLAAAQAIQLDSGIVIPQGMKLSLLEAKRNGTADYKELYDRMQGVIAKVMVGQTASIEGTSGKLGSENERGQVKDEYVKADADLICGAFNSQVARWLTEWNYPGAAVPQVWRVLDDSEDLSARAERDSKIFVFSGRRPSVDYLKEVYGGEYELTEAAMPALPVEPVEPTPQFAEHSCPHCANHAEGDEDLADVYAARVDESVREDVESMVETVKALLKASPDMAYFREQLAALYPKMDIARMTEKIRDGMIAADLAGRAEVDDGR